MRVSGGGAGGGKVIGVWVFIIGIFFICSYIFYDCFYQEFCFLFLGLMFLPISVDDFFALFLVLLFVVVVMGCRDLLSCAKNKDKLKQENRRKYSIPYHIFLRHPVLSFYYGSPPSPIFSPFSLCLCATIPNLIALVAAECTCGGRD